MLCLNKLTLAVTAALVSFPLSSMADTGPSSYADPYLQPVAQGVKLTSLLTTGDAADNGYRMTGIPDGLGAYDNKDGTFTVLMNHELGSSDGVAHDHNSPSGKGAFISEWVIDKKTLRVLSGEDLIKKVYGWDAANQSSNPTPSLVNLNRLCSADLPSRSAFYNHKSHLGSKARIFLNGEEGGNNGYALAHVATGPEKGNTYVLGKFNLATNGSNIAAVGGWENLVANPRSGDKTVVIGTNDGGTGLMNNTVAVYVGSKTNVGTEADKAGLTNGKIKFISVKDHADGSGATNEEINNTTDRTTGIVSGTAFSLSDSAVTTFSRPEDGAWADAKTFYFVTTDQIDKTDLAGGTQKGGTRLWRLNFNDDYTGGTIDVVIDSTQIAGGLDNKKPSMFDNMNVNSDGTLTLQEDVGNNEHNGKVWLFDPRSGKLTILAKFDPALFGDIDDSGNFTAGTHTKDEEASGVIDITHILKRHHGNTRYSLLVAQNHASAAHLQSIGAIDTTVAPGELIQGGQLLLLSHTHKGQHSKED